MVGCAVWGFLSGCRYEQQKITEHPYEFNLAEQLKDTPFRMPKMQTTTDSYNDGRPNVVTRQLCIPRRNAPDFILSEKELVAIYESGWDWKPDPNAVGLFMIIEKGSE